MAQVILRYDNMLANYQDDCVKSLSLSKNHLTVFHILSSNDSLIVFYRTFWMSTSPSTFHLYTLRQSFSPSHTLTCTSLGYDRLGFPHSSLLLYVNLLHLLPGIVLSHWNQIPLKTSLCRFSLITPTISSNHSLSWLSCNPCLYGIYLRHLWKWHSIVSAYTACFHPPSRGLMGLTSLRVPASLWVKGKVCVFVCTNVYVCVCSCVGLCYLSQRDFKSPT